MSSAPFGLPLELSVRELVMQFGVAYAQNSQSTVHLKGFKSVADQVAPFEFQFDEKTDQGLPPISVESILVSGPGFKDREIPVFIELSKSLGHPEVAAHRSPTSPVGDYRTRTWNRDEFRVVLTVLPHEQILKIQVSRSEESFTRLKKKQTELINKIDELELASPNIVFEFLSVHSWLDAALVKEAVGQAKASKNGNHYSLSATGKRLDLRKDGQLSLVMRDFGERDTILGFNLFVACKNPSGGFPEFVEAAFCSVKGTDSTEIEKMGRSLAQFWSVAFRREISIARY